jgi:hypothetical protein
MLDLPEMTPNTPIAQALEQWTQLHRLRI